MQRGNEGRQFVLGHVLELINEYSQRSVGLLSGLTGRFQQSLQVMLQIAVIGKARLRVKVEADFDVLVFDLQGLSETSETTQRTVGV